MSLMGCYHKLFDGHVFVHKHLIFRVSYKKKDGNEMRLLVLGDVATLHLWVKNQKI
jgi:hypothetical protein